MFFNDLLYRLRALFQRARMDSEADEELEFHIEKETEKWMRSGMPEADARRRARVALGGWTQAREECRQARGIAVLSTIAGDIRHGLRMLRKSPGFTAVAVGSMALGIGANIVVFSVVDTFLLRPLPFPNADEVVSVLGRRGPHHSFPNYLDLRDRNAVFAQLAAHRITAMGLESAEGSERVWGYLVTGNYFDTLGARPRLGRFFGPDEDRIRNGSPYAVLSYSCWRNRFAGDSGIVGRTIRLNGLAYTVLGVAGEDFQGTELFYWPEIWVPMSMQGQIEGYAWLDNRSTFNTAIFGRLRAGITWTQAESHLAPIAALMAKEHPAWNESLQFRLRRPGMLNPENSAATAAMALFLPCLVLLAACVNLAGLLTARTIDRSRELAVRMSLGAGRARIAGQLITESMLLALAGGVAAWGLAWLLLRLLSQWHAPLDFPIQFQVEPDWRVVVFTGSVSILSGLIFGLAPAYRAWRTEPNPALKGSPIGGRYRWSLRDFLLPAQVAICSVLVMSTFTAFRGLQKLMEIPLGFEPSGISVAGFDLGLSRYKDPQGRTLQREAVEAASRLPGVISAAYANSVPLSIDQSSSSVAPESAAGFRPADRIESTVYQVSPGYFQTMGTRLLGGREFSWDDTAQKPPVAIVNETLARKLFGTADAVGRRFRTGPNSFAEVVGVAQDGKYRSLIEEPSVRNSQPAYFRPATQSYNGTTVLLVRTAGPGVATAGQLRRLLAGLDAKLAVYGVGSLSQLLGFAFFPAHAITTALSIFGILAVVLASTGIYGMAAYALSRRQREIGIRLAIGAGPRQVLQTVLGRTMALAGIGAAAGFVFGIAAGPVLARIVLGASPWDLQAIAGASMVMAAVALLAVGGPVQRALRIDPVRALRQE